MFIDMLRAKRVTLDRMVAGAPGLLRLNPYLVRVEVIKNKSFVLRSPAADHISIFPFNFSKAASRFFFSIFLIFTIFH